MAQLRSATEGSALPDWLNASWPVVVRRDRQHPEWIAVGVRGAQRSLRHAAWLAHDAVGSRVNPESLKLAWQLHPELLQFECVAKLRRLYQPLTALNLPWGPTGSVGFTLATGAALLRPDSDLDLLIRCATPLSRQQTATLAELQQRQNNCRVDIQIDTGSGGFALSEWSRGGKVLLKTADGPVLTATPWERCESSRARP